MFCKIVAGEIPCHKIWEDEKHLAFLSIFPNTEGFSVVITRDHNPSYVFDNDDETISGLMVAARQVARKIDDTFVDVGRTGVMFEGFGVDHLHCKLFPMHGTGDMAKWQPVESERREYFKQYPGYLSSHDAGRADDKQLEQVAKKIRETKIE